MDSPAGTPVGINPSTVPGYHVVWLNGALNIN